MEKKKVKLSCYLTCQGRAYWNSAVSALAGVCSTDKCTEQTIPLKRHKRFNSYRLTLGLFIIRKYQDIAMKLAWSHPAVKSQRNIVAASQIACFDLARGSPINTNHNMGDVVPNYTNSKWHFPNF